MVCSGQQYVCIARGHFWTTNQRAMSLLATFCFTCFAVSSIAFSCNQTQHCTRCNNTGHCITDCDPGYYDYKCTSVCSKNCRNKTCTISNIGSGTCTHGCLPGFQGTSCNIPCDNPGGNCTVCPGGCDGGYCQLASSCVSGCVDGYYGADCNQGGRYSAYSNTAVIALSFFCVYVTLTILVTIVLRCRDITREGSREPVEDEYHHIRHNSRTSPGTALHTDELYSELDDISTDRVVVFL
ncbi:scavenger receptor class F member 2-like [Haliotis asinina]|uniref:scavenger receptor class F member 2-like n=1 Tax=Haliotis asinina TaxID=109174 RepID=UPI00353230B7